VAHGGLVYALEREHLRDAPRERLANLAGIWLTHDGTRVVVGERLELIDEDPATEHQQPAQAAARRVI